MIRAEPIRAAGDPHRDPPQCQGYIGGGGRPTELVADDALQDAALARAAAVLKVAPLAAAEMKRLIRQGADAALPTALAFEQEVLARLYTTADGQEGIAAFLDKREPNFKGA